MSFGVPFALLIIKTKNNPMRRVIFSYLENNYLAGDESLNWHPLIEDFILMGQKLEQLGFFYSRSEVFTSITAGVNL